MNISAYIKRLGVVVFVLGVAVGCATAPEEEEMAEEPDQEQQQLCNEAEAAIDSAKSKNADARAMGADWRGAREVINEAEVALQEGDCARAKRLAGEAEAMAEDAIAAYRAEQERKEAEKREEDRTRSYTVSHGDTLWDISGSAVGYNDPYQWPLIYRANQDKIKDADLIYPGQDFEIQANPSAGQVDMAIEHARNRGEWELGVTEGSDLRYLREAGEM